MRFALRPYQHEAMTKLRNAVVRGKRRIIVVAPTGSGKTVVAGALIESAAQKNSDILFLAHRRELIEQCSHKLDEIGIDHGILMANHPRTDPSKKVQIASVQTLIRRDKPHADLIFVDEAHRCLADSYTSILNDYPNAVVIGLTATPWRTDGRGLGRVYEEIIVSSSVNELSSQGYLIIPKVYAPDVPNLSGIKIVRGDYESSALAARMNNSRLIGDIVKHWRKLANDRRTVVFAAGVAHSKHIAQMFRQAGINAEHVDGEMNVKERDGILVRLRKGETTILCNCDIVTEGYDLPVLSCAVLARPTKSSVKYLQMVGRIMRPEADKKDAIVLDHAGCALTHGFVQDERMYNLCDKHKHKKNNNIKVKICKHCFNVMSVNVRRCPGCGSLQVAESPVREIPNCKNGNLVEISPHDRFQCSSCHSTDTKQIRSTKFGVFKVAIACNQCQSFEVITDRYKVKHASMGQLKDEYKRLCDICQVKGYKQGWAKHNFKAIFGIWPDEIKLNRQ